MEAAKEVELRLLPLDALPEPDKWGNFWFGPRGHGDSPAIFVRLSGPRRGTYLAQRGKAGMVWDGAELRTFKEPEAALKALRKLAEGRGGR